MEIDWTEIESGKERNSQAIDRNIIASLPLAVSIISELSLPSSRRVLVREKDGKGKKRKDRLVRACMYQEA
jgi:hypothetical protein